jgi:hypothetical protein
MSIAQNLQTILERIDQAAQACGRDPKSIRLVAVSKTKPASAVQEAFKAGQILFGENYVQELTEKAPALGQGPEWHFIGHLQSNKAKPAALHSHVVETVDRLKLAKALDRHAGEAGKTLGVLLQVNVGEEMQKSGCTEDDAKELALKVAELPNLELKGLMTLPPFFDQPEKVRPIFAKLYRLAQNLAKDLPQGAMDELSMGMSGDFEAAIKEGATLVRVGTAIFGAREYHK